MQIRVRLSSGLVELIGIPRLNMSLKDNATVADLREEIYQKYPELQDAMATAIPIVMGEHVSFSAALSNGQEVAFLLPVAGG